MTTPKGIVGGFEFTVFQRNLKEWHEGATETCLRVLKESNKNRFDSYSVRNSVLSISHITFRDCRVHIFFDSLSRNGCMPIQCIHISYIFKIPYFLFRLKAFLMYRWPNFQHSTSTTTLGLSAWYDVTTTISFICIHDYSKVYNSIAKAT